MPMKYGRTNYLVYKPLHSKIIWKEKYQVKLGIVSRQEKKQNINRRFLSKLTN